MTILDNGRSDAGAERKRSQAYTFWRVWGLRKVAHRQPEGMASAVSTSVRGIPYPVDPFRPAPPAQIPEKRQKFAKICDSARSKN